MPDGSQNLSTFPPQATLIRNLQEYGRTPVSWAAERRHEAVVQLLLEKGANIDAKAKSGEVVLHRATENGHEAVVRLLVEKGTNVDTKGPSRRRGHRGPVCWRMSYDSLSRSGRLRCGCEAEPRMRVRCGGERGKLPCAVTNRLAPMSWRCGLGTWRTQVALCT